MLEGDELRQVAHFGPVESVPPVVVRLNDIAGGLMQALHEHRTVQVSDVRDLPAEDALVKQSSHGPGVRTLLSTPMLYGDRALGGIQIRRYEVRPFTDEQV